MPTHITPRYLVIAINLAKLLMHYLHAANKKLNHLHVI